MKRHSFTFGKPYQNNTAVWARRRLADDSGRTFKRVSPEKSDQFPEVDQDGVLLADGVGLGKTWEALAAAALIMMHRVQETKSGSKRQRVPRQPMRILVLCPPGLVTKWRSEVRQGDGFGGALEAWWKKQKHLRRSIRDTLLKPIPIRRRSDLEGLDPAYRKGKSNELVLSGGLYIASWNIPRRCLGPGHSRLRTFQSQDWDVIIVDEAHHLQARNALLALRSHRHGREQPPTLLLTATPFQLEPREMHSLLGNAVTHREERLFDKKPLSEFVGDLRAFFENDRASRRVPACKLKDACEKTLRQLVARNLPPSSRRVYHFIGADGVAKLVENFHTANAAILKKWSSRFVPGSKKFRIEYLQARFALAGGRRGRAAKGLSLTFRQMLSSPGQSRKATRKARIPDQISCYPRLDALRDWTIKVMKDNLRRSIRDGLPRKILVFTSFVGDRRTGAVSELKGVLQEAFDCSLRELKRTADWRRALAEGQSKRESFLQGIERIVKKATEDRRKTRPLDGVGDRLKQALDKHELLLAMIGRKRFRDQVYKEIRSRIAEILAPSEEGDHIGDLERKILSSERRRAKKALDTLASLDPVQTFAGTDDQKEREASGLAFQTPFFPWVLVASNVGSEGIDLQRYTRHLVHYDLEWNPAKMAQREGRGDRLGRRLNENLSVYFLIVRETYDERMLHQVIARERWHSVLLGRPVKALTRVESGNGRPERDPLVAPWLAKVDGWVLDLRPRSKYVSSGD